MTAWLDVRTRAIRAIGVTNWPSCPDIRIGRLSEEDDEGEEIEENEDKLVQGDGKSEKDEREREGGGEWGS